MYKLNAPIILLSILIACSYNVSSKELKIGSKCFTEDTNIPGICIKFSDCPRAIYDLKHESKYPESCDMGFIDTDEIICCVPISETKCKQYSKSVYRYLEGGPLIMGAEQIETSACVVDDKTMIAGGEAAKEKEFPHMTLIGYRSATDATKMEWICGGSLISEQFVLTAAHCLLLETSDRSPTHVRLGTLNKTMKEKSEANKGVQNYLIKMCYKHPGYTGSTRYYDIGLIKIAENVIFTDYVRPACINRMKELEQTPLLATGWGIIDKDTYTKTDLLRKVQLEVVDHENCKKKYTTRINSRLNKGIDHETQLCAGDLKAGKNGTCEGDSGGPLQVLHPEYDCMFSIVSVTCFGVVCGSRQPGVYAKVSYFANWIESVVWLKSEEGKIEYVNEALVDGPEPIDTPQRLKKDDYIDVRKHTEF